MRTSDCNVYLAAPFFNDEQIDRMKSVLNMLRDFGFNVYAPYEDGVFEYESSTDLERLQCFKDNLKSIQNSDLVFCITNDRDMGSLWEAGFAYARGKSVVYYCEGLEGPFNLMLAQSGILTITDFNELWKVPEHVMFYL